MSEQDQLFQDKIGLCSTIVEKDLNNISLFVGLINQIKMGQIEMQDLDKWMDYHNCWKGFAELYYVLKSTYGNKLEKKEKKGLNEIFNRYKDLKKVTFEDLKKFSSGVSDIVARSGFYDVIRKSESQAGLDKVKKRYGIKDDE